VAAKENISVPDGFPGPVFRDGVFASHEHSAASEYPCKAHKASFYTPVFENCVYHVGGAARGINAAMSEKWRK
jgi:hypothetical protein